MTLTIKDSLDMTGTSKPGSSAQISVNTPGESPRSNPVCLEVPVTVRSLPGENGNAPGAAGPTREEGRSVIVFDNGGVLRMANPLAPGRTVILSNQQGRDVVCRVVGGRNLPNIKGYIEVEFNEPVNDFWHIHQTPEQPRAASRPTPELPAFPMQPSQVEQAVASLVPSRPAVPAKEKESDAASSGAPTFEDVAGLVLMSPSGAPREKKNEPSAPLLTPPGKNKVAQSQIETTSLKSTEKQTPPISELPSERPAPSMAQAAVSAPARTQNLLHEFTGKGAQISVPSSFVASVSSGEPRGRTPLLLGGAALVLVGLGAGYFFMYRGTPQVAEVPAAATSQPSALSAGASSGSRNAPAPQAAVEQAPVQTPQQAAQPVSTASSGSAGSTAPASSDRQNTKSRSTTADANQPDSAAARRQPIPNLKMSSPIRSGQKLGKLPDGSAAGAEDLNLTMAAGGSPSPAFALRAVSQPAPPPAEISTPSARTSVDAKLISSTRPVYPAMARQTRVQGSVVIKADIDEKGSVVGARAISGPPFLRQAAIDAVNQWKYSPAQINGKPAVSQITVSIQFQLN
jgi:TonB family protein